MNLHEYQAKTLFKEYGLPVSEGHAVGTADEAVGAVQRLGPGPWVAKVQAHAGGRGKAGGVRRCETLAEVRAFSEEWLGKRLVTAQTTAEGQPVSRVYVEPCTEIKAEFYLGVVIDRSRRRVVFIASTEGGVEIEKVAEETPDKILRVSIDPFTGAQSYQGRRLAFDLGLRGTQASQFTDLFLKLAKLFHELDCALLEINPLILTTEGKIHCLDAKINIDANALYRQPRLQEMRDPAQEDEREDQAARYNLNYVALEGNIGCMVNGAGLAMGTMDLVKHRGGTPANFLDVGGGATAETVGEAFKIILSDKNVRAVLINIFGGIVSCVTIADGIIGAVREVGVQVPVVVRFEGNNAEEGRGRLLESGLNIIAGESLTDAAQKVVVAAEGRA